MSIMNLCTYTISYAHIHINEIRCATHDIVRLHELLFLSPLPINHPLPPYTCIRYSSFIASWSFLHLLLLSSSCIPSFLLLLFLLLFPLLFVILPTILSRLIPFIFTFYGYSSCSFSSSFSFKTSDYIIPLLNLRSYSIHASYRRFSLPRRLRFLPPSHPSPLPLPSSLPPSIPVPLSPPVYPLSRPRVI